MHSDTWDITDLQNPWDPRDGEGLDQNNIVAAADGVPSHS